MITLSAHVPRGYRPLKKNMSIRLNSFEIG